MTRPCLALSIVLLAVAACGELPQRSQLLPQTAALLRAGAEPGAVTVRIVGRRNVTPDYLSPASKGLTVTIAGPTTVTKTAGLSVGDQGCTSTLLTVQCALTLTGLSACPSSKPCYAASVAIYDAYNAAHNRIPHGARELSAISGLKFSPSSGTTVIPLVLDGIPKKIAFVPAADTLLSGSQALGFVAPKCSIVRQRVSLVGVDADGNYIVGPGSPSTDLKSDDPSQLAVSRPKPASPNEFALSPPKAPAYPYGGLTIHLTAKATPRGHAGTAVSTVVRVTYSPDICGVFTEFTIPSAGAHPYGMAAGPDGALWFTEASTNKIGRVTTTGSFTEFSIPTAGSLPVGIAAGPDGNLWFVENNASNVGRITTGGVFAEFQTPTHSSSPYQITAGPDGNVWFAEDGANQIGRITPSGVTTEFSVPTANAGAYGIAAGSDGNIWFTESTADKIGVMTPSGFATDFAIPTASSTPIGILSGPNGEMWFTECNGGKLGRADEVNHVNAEELLPEANSQPTFMTHGPGGTTWFSETLGNRVAEIAGEFGITEYAVPTSGAYPFGIASGPDGAIWIDEFLSSKIARLR